MFATPHWSLRDSFLCWLADLFSSIYLPQYESTPAFVHISLSITTNTHLRATDIKFSSSCLYQIYSIEEGVGVLFVPL